MGQRQRYVECRQGRNCHPGQRRNQGFAILLYSYLVVFFLFIFTSTILTRSMVELQYAQRSLGLNQAFWQAESALEQAVTQMRVWPDITGPQGIVNCGAGWYVPSGQAPTSQYQLCLDAVVTSTNAQQVSRYQIQATGTSLGVSRTVTATVLYTANTIIFDRTLYSNIVGLNKVGMGGMDTRVSRVPNPVPSDSGDVASVRTTPLDCSTGTCPGFCSAQPSCLPITLSNNTVVNGSALVGPGLTQPETDALIAVSANSSVISKGNLASVPVWPVVTVPTGTTDLASILPHDATGLVTVSSAVIPAGVYTVSQTLKLQDVEICTNGPVEIYMSPGQAVGVWHGAKFYGQPAGTTSCTMAISPQDLRLFYTGTGSQQIRHVQSNDGPESVLLGAILYAPNAYFNLQTLLLNIKIVGAAILGQSFGLAPAAGSANLLYDVALQTQRFRVGPAAIQVLAWAS